MVKIMRAAAHTLDTIGAPIIRGLAALTLLFIGAATLGEGMDRIINLG